MTYKDKLIEKMNSMTAEELAKAITTCCPNAFFKDKYKNCSRLGCETCWKQFLEKETSDSTVPAHEIIVELRKFKDKDRVIFDKTAVNSILNYLELAYLKET